ncbi:MAG: hypothetical protein JSW50_11985, partial [Candidatus Latescibacterota bacterium]
AALLVPSVFRGLVRAFQTKGMLYVAALIRITVGVLLLLAAPECKFPLGVRVLGVFTIFAGAVLPFIKQSTADALFLWVSKLPDSAMRGFALVGIVLGAFLVYVSA